jgi:hypothetical protein
VSTDFGYCHCALILIFVPQTTNLGTHRNLRQPLNWGPRNDAGPRRIIRNRLLVSFTDRVRNEEALHRVKQVRNILHTIKSTKANWIGHILRRNCLLKHVIEGKVEGRIEITRRRGIRRKQLLDDLKERRR